MRVYIVRHGDALTPPGGRERSLTERGERDATSAGELLEAQGLDYLLHSPLLRTRQTAAHILDAVGDIPSAASESLVPPATGEEVVAAIESVIAERIALVSHMPLVAHLVSWFTSGDYRDYSLPGFPEAGIVALDMEIVGRGLAKLAWYAFPPNYGITQG